VPCVLQILVSMIVTDLAATESGFEQSVRVSFVQSTQADTRTLQTFSGNPGYLKGFPLLVSFGQWVPAGSHGRNGAMSLVEVHATLYPECRQGS
jgi:hypothetical protein